MLYLPPKALSYAQEDAQHVCRVVEPHRIRSNFQTLCRWEKQVDAKAGKFSTPEMLGCVYAPSAAPDGFCGQILRSIDARSADLETGRNLFMKKGRGVDDSIYRVSFSLSSCLSPCPSLSLVYICCCTNCSRTVMVACRATSITSGVRKGTCTLVRLCPLVVETRLSLLEIQKGALLKAQCSAM